MLEIEVVVAHLNHGLRGDAAAADAAFVEGLASRIGVACHVGTWKPRRASHFEADARRARYDWLARVATEIGASAIVVGHTRDDQVETILHRILRGTGPRGLAGIPKVRRLECGVALVRPLLDVSRQEIRRLLESQGIGWREDATNDDRAYTRARIRSDLLPALRSAYNPRVDDALVRLAGLVAAEHERIERWAERRAARMDRSTDAHVITLNLEELRRLRVSSRAEVIRAARRAKGWPERAMTARHWVQLARLGERNAGELSVATNVAAEVRGDALIISRGPRAMPPIEPAAVLSVPGTVDWGGITLVAGLEMSDAQGLNETVDFDRLAFAAESASATLEVRAARPGDRFEPLGMSGCSQKLSAFLRARGVPRSERSKVPIVCDRAGIVWVVNHRIADRVKITAATTRKLWLRAEPQAAAAPAVPPSASEP